MQIYAVVSRSTKWTEHMTFMKDIRNTYGITLKIRSGSMGVRERKLKNSEHGDDD
jgi:hypothetical protein